MPVIKVWGLPDVGENTFIKIFQKIVAAAESVELLRLRPGNSVTVFFPKGQMYYGLGEEIIIEVSGLFEELERSENVRNELARKLGKVLVEFFPAALVECFVQSFNPSQGFWSSSS